ncbi:MAG TPA: hypothetical protein VGS57_14840 [Thermoanaerobaculia bacterium]|jgi:hypothetical protein|nr:hypothetical protein [Thermoanaerobaculia bacterium]
MVWILNPMTWPWARIAYTSVLLLLAVIALREIWRAWTDNALYVGSFRYRKNGVEQAAAGDAFAAEVLHYHQLLARRLQEEYTRRQRHARAASSVTQGSPPETEIGRLPLDVAPIVSPENALADMELKVQGFDIGQLLSRLRSGVRPQNELSGDVDDLDGSITVSVRWSGGPSEARGAAVTADHFAIAGIRDNDAAAFRVACRLIHAQGAMQRASKYLSQVPAEEFCEWAWWWKKYRDMVDRGQREALTDDDDKTLSAIRKGVDYLIRPTARYAELWRLRANVLETTRNRSPEDDAQLAEDWRTYASLLAQSPNGPVGSVSSGAARATAERVEAAKTTPTLPIVGRWVWTSEYAAVTVTAIVVDEGGAEFLLLPDYASSASGGAPVVFSSAPRGGVVLGRRGRRIPLPGSTGAIGGILLVPLDAGVRVSPLLPDRTGIQRLAKVGIGDRLVLWGGERGRTELTVSSVDVELNDISGLIKTEKATQGGDGGAPVLNSKGDLVAMGYMGSESASFLLPLKDLLEQNNLRVR